VAAFLIVRLFRHPTGTALIISASLAQIGEFSFILAALGVDLQLLPQEGRDLILAGAILSILANPLLFAAIDRLQGKKVETPDSKAPADEIAKTALTDHTVIVGGGRVGTALIDYLRAAGLPFLVIEDRTQALKSLRADGVEVIAANAADPQAIAAANIAGARRLFVAIDNAFEAGQAVEQARAANGSLEIIARAISSGETQHLRQRGADRIVVGADAIAQGMLAKAFKEAL
jgi:CPA2 family monovalent cation:H+ antiporter-2